MSRISSSTPRRYGGRSTATCPTPRRGPRPSVLSTSTTDTTDHYMPTQGLFDKEQVADMVLEDDFNFEPEAGTHSWSPTDAHETHLMRLYGSSEASLPDEDHHHAYNPAPDHNPVDAETPPPTMRHARSFEMDGRTPSQRGSRQINYVALLQEQQGLLQKVLSQQEVMNKQQNEILRRQSQMELKIKALEEAGKISSTSGSDKPKRRVTRQLTNLIADAYDNHEESFKPCESSLSPHNQSVKNELVKKVASDKFSRDLVKHGIQRKYEMVRRQWTLQQKENFSEIVEAKARQSKHRARRIRKFQNRSIVVKESEKKYWESITPAFLTEVSDDDDDATVIIEHKLTWRSKKLNDFMEELDRRYECKVKKEGGAVMAKKSRREGAPSESACPPGAPKWAVSQDSVE